MSRMDIWRSKEDILKDLSQVTVLCDAFDNYIVRGERPPPPRKIEEDQEMRSMYPDSEPLANDLNQGPDLVGIRQMLQMVKDYDDVDEDQVDHLAPDKDIIEISKLNPNVKEFIPKALTSSSPKNKRSKYGNSEQDGSSIIDTPNVLSGSNKCNKKEDCHVTNIKKNVDTSSNESNRIDTSFSLSNDTGKFDDAKDRSDINMDKRIDISTLKPAEINDITKKLKNKIISASQKDSQSKRERNVAIATLLKLYASKSSLPKSPIQDSVEKPILYTPEYFEKSIPKVLPKSDHLLSEINTEVPQRDATSDPSCSNTPVKNIRDNIDSQKAATITSPDSNVHIPEDQDVRLSIEKVNNWLEKPATPKPALPKQKGPSVFLGPISFKKKDISKSPLSDDSKRATPVKGINTTNVKHFKPSKYAEDLSKMYIERNKELDGRTSDMWSKLEKDLKAKEERMKKELLLKSPSSSPGGRDCSSQEENVDAMDSGR